MAEVEPGGVQPATPGGPFPFGEWIVSRAVPVSRRVSALARARGLGVRPGLEIDKFGLPVDWRELQRLVPLFELEMQKGNAEKPQAKSLRNLRAVLLGGVNQRRYMRGRGPNSGSKYAVEGPGGERVALRVLLEATADRVGGLKRGISETLVKALRLEMAKAGYKLMEGDPTKREYYRDRVTMAMMRSARKPGDKKVQDGCKAEIDFLERAAAANGVDFKAPPPESLEAVFCKCATMFENTDAELTAMEKRQEELPTDLKKRLLGLMPRIRRVRKNSRAYPCHFCHYVLRMQESDREREKMRDKLPEDSVRFGFLVMKETQWRILATMVYRNRWLVRIHPSAGKSTLQKGAKLWRIVHDVNLRSAYVTHGETKSQKDLSYLKQAFTPDNGMGRRLRALFPGFVIDPAKARRMDQFTLYRTVSAVEPTVEAPSYMGNVEGDKYGDMDFDDPIPSSDRFEPTNRQRHVDKYLLTWEKRAAGAGVAGMAGTPWAPGDLYDTIAKFPDVFVRDMPVGPNFEPVCPELVSEADLRLAYAKNPVLYQHSYRLQAVSDEARLVPEVSYYDPESPEGLAVEAGGAVDGRTVFVLVDPGGAGQGQATDYCGVSRMVIYRQRAYVTWCRKWQAVPKRMYERLEGISLDPTVGMDMMVVETVGQAAPYQLEFFQKCPSIGGCGKFRSYTPGVKSKPERLYLAAGPIMQGRVVFRGTWIGAGQERHLTADRTVREGVEQVTSMTRRDKPGAQNDLVDTVTMGVQLNRHEITPVAPGAAPADDGLTDEERRIRAAVGEILGGKKAERGMQRLQPVPMRLGWAGRGIAGVLGLRR